MDSPIKIVYCTPSLYIPGGVERVLSTKANYLADILGYDITIILTDGKDKMPYYKLSDKIRIIQLDINFEELWNKNIIIKTYLYLKKQKIYKKKLTETLLSLRPDITISLLRREINFITSIKDGSKKVGELHVNRSNYRNFENVKYNIFKIIISRVWMQSLIHNVKKLDNFIVLTNEDKNNWKELNNINVISNPLSFNSKTISNLSSKKVIAVGRYTYQKGFDLLIKSWKIVNQHHPDWELFIYGEGEKEIYHELIQNLKIQNCIHLNKADSNIKDRFLESSICAFSSRYEGFGMVIAESMICGVPVVSFDCPCGPKDIIKNNEDGLLVKSYNINEFANKIIYLIENSNVRKTLGYNAYNNIQRYKVSNIMNQWDNLFQSLALK